MWIIDFGIGMAEADAALYEAAFEHVKTHVKPERDKVNREAYRRRWWQHVEPRTGMRAALAGLPRFLGTPRVTKHRLFVWLDLPTLADAQLIVFARSDDYFFGVLHSRLHEVWARAQATQLRERESGLRYTPTTCFETFPFPWPGDVARPIVARLSETDSDVARLAEADSEVARLAEADSLVARHSVADGNFRPGGADYGTDHGAQAAAIAAAARELNDLRDRWLNPPEWVEEEDIVRYDVPRI
jgi:hypothetical protein